MVFGPRRHGPAQPAACAGRAAVHGRRAVRSVAEPAPPSPLVDSG